MKYLLFIMAMGMDPSTIKTIEMPDKATCEMAVVEINKQMKETVSRFTEGFPAEMQALGNMKGLGIGLPLVMACIKQ